MCHLIFDTETSGFLTPNYPIDHPNQGRVLSVAALLLDEKFEEVSHFYALIDVPETIQIHPTAFQQHGLTVEKCKRFGIPIETALLMFGCMMKQSMYQVGHNISFDISMLQNEEKSVFQGEESLLFPNPTCTMHLTTEICKLPNLNPKVRSKYKWPKLSEAYEYVTGKPLEGAHNALKDVRGCSAIYKWLCAEGHIQIAPIIVEE